MRRFFRGENESPSTSSAGLARLQERDSGKRRAVVKLSGAGSGSGVAVKVNLDIAGGWWTSLACGADWHAIILP